MSRGVSRHKKRDIDCDITRDVSQRRACHGFEGEDFEEGELMKPVAWVVEVKRWQGSEIGARWLPWLVRETRREARHEAKDCRAAYEGARVVRYVRDAK
jgi:hypothetical protein